MIGQVIHVLLSSMPSSESSRLAWLNRTPKAVASGRINQIYLVSILWLLVAIEFADLKFWRENERTCFLHKIVIISISYLTSSELLRRFLEIAYVPALHPRR